MLAFPVAVLAMLEISLPWTLSRGIICGYWFQAALSTVVVLGCGQNFMPGCCGRARNLAANMDTLISLGTLTALI